MRNKRFDKDYNLKDRVIKSQGQWNQSQVLCMPKRYPKNRVILDEVSKPNSFIKIRSYKIDETESLFQPNLDMINSIFHY